MNLPEAISTSIRSCNRRKHKGQVTGTFEHIHLRFHIYLIILKLQRRTHTRNLQVLLLRANDSWKRIQKAIPESPKNLTLNHIKFLCLSVKNTVSPSVHHKIVVNPTARDELFKI